MRVLRHSVLYPIRLILISASPVNMSSRRVKVNNKIGEGAFGQVVVVNDKIVRKVYDELRCMLQETMMLRFMCGSTYIVEIDSFNTSVPSVNIQRWSCSLRELLKKKDISMHNKMKVFKCMLMGLSHLHQMGILHSDFKLSNILVNEETYDACICDLGLSSLAKYAKIGQTAPKYRPSKLVYAHGHDMFGLCVSMVDLFSGGAPNKIFTAKELRSLIRGLAVKDKVKNMLCKMCPDDPSSAITVDEVLVELFEKRTVMKKCVAVIHDNKIDETTVKYLKKTFEVMTETYSVNRGLRCFESTFNFFNSEVGSSIDRYYWPIYISAAIFIYSSLFGTRKYDQRVALISAKNKFTIEDLYDALDVLISDDNFLFMTIA